MENTNVKNDNQIRIVILDTGIDINSQVSIDLNIKSCIEFSENEDGEVSINYNSFDDIGHGTAVASIIHKELPEAILYPIKVIHSGILNSTKTLIAALNYIKHNIECDIINISIGLVCCDQINELEECCKSLVQSGVIILAAFDNAGAVSYPAAFDCVIGIDGYRSNHNKNSYIHIKNSIVNYIGRNIEQIVPWIDGKVEMASGNSFLVPKFTIKVAKKMLNEKMDFRNITEFLNTSAETEFEYSSIKIPKLRYKINKAIIFPFNKEIHSLARFQNMLPFDIIGYYDVKYSGNINIEIKKLQNIDNNDHVVRNIESFNWNTEFDTVIMGHISELSRATNRDWEKLIIEKCILHNKQLISFKDIRNHPQDQLENLQYYCPVIDNLDTNFLKKMHVIGRPVLGIVGTSSKQGKFTLQLEIREALIKLGYKVGQLGTEPSSFLFGIDETYPMGYESSVSVQGINAVYVVNKLMAEIEKKQPDIIIFGSQSQTIPIYAGGEQEFPVAQHELLLGCQADAYILCVNSTDSIEYIRRNILYLESLLDSTVIALVISPFISTARWSVISSRIKLLSNCELDQFKKQLQNEFSIPAFVLNESNAIHNIVNLSIEFFNQ